MPSIPRHRVFVSYHHANDENYKNIFELRFGNAYKAIHSRSVKLGDIDGSVSTDGIRRIIRDRYLTDSTVTIVLVGTETYKRKHVDWEIGASLRNTVSNVRSGLLGILLPSYHATMSKPNTYAPDTIPPRLRDNVDSGYATLHTWSNDAETVAGWIHKAYNRRFTVEPDNSHPNFGYNR
jgi:hypothetical protein